MRLLLIRHGDPDYALDSLTETGKIEAELLSHRIAPQEIARYYVSTMGRARETAAPTLKLAGREGIERDWLREFSVPIQRPDREEITNIPWDWLPQDWLAEPLFLDPERWSEPEVFRNSQIREAYDSVTRAFDEVLSEFGYRREGPHYRVERQSSETIAFFCHLGVSCVLMSHLMHVSPMVLWHGLAMPPSSVTTIYSEERRPGTAIFRASSVGDISHLWAAGREPSFSARFCETYGNGQRVD